MSPPTRAISTSCGTPTNASSKMRSPGVPRPQVSRRSFLRLTAGGALAGGVGLSLLIDGCAPPPPPPKPTSAPAPGGGPLPTFIAQSGGPKPDFHSADPRITDGFVRFPKDPVKSWSGGPPSNGATLNVFIAAYYPPPTGRDQNTT